MECDGIYLLEGWVKSKGARLEKVYAANTGIKDITVKVNESKDMEDN